jgi:O-antigen/teichoic acid export membrane protein
VRPSLSFTVLCRLVATICGVATAFISLRIYNIYLTKEVYGTVLVALQFLAYLPLVGGGFSMVLGQQMLADQDQAGIARTARFTQILQSHILVIALLAGLALMAFYSQMPAARSVKLPIALFFAIGFAGVMTFYAGGQIGLLTGLGHQLYSIILQGVWSILGLLLLWAFFFVGWGVWAMPGSTAMSALLLLPVAWVLQQRLVAGLPILTWQRDAEFWSRVRKAWFPAMSWLHGQLSIMLLFTLDIILMGMLFGPGAAAVYGIISRITAMSRQLIQSLCDTAWPRLTQEPDIQRKAALMRKVDRLNAWITGAWYGSMAATLHPFLGWLMKTDWIAGPLLIGLMLTRTMIVSLSAPHSYGLLSAGRFKDIARACQREVLLSVAAIFIFGHFFGMVGVAMATLAATTGGSLWYLTYLYFRPLPDQNWFQEWRAVYARGLISAGLSFVVARAAWGEIHHLFSAPGWLALLAGGAGFGAGLVVALAFATWQSGGQAQSTGRFLKLPANW